MSGWQDSFVPDSGIPQAVQANGWQSSFVPDSQSQQPQGQPAAGGIDAAPESLGDPENGGNTNGHSFPQQLYDWASKPSEVDLSDLPKPGQDSGILDKLNAAQTALGRGLVASGEDMFVKPVARGMANLMEASGQAASGHSVPAEAVITPDTMAALTVLGPRSSALNASNELPAVVPPSPTTAAEAKQVASQFYQQAQDSGGILRPDFTNNFINKVSQAAPQTAEGKIFAGETPITQLVDRIQALRDKPLSLPAVQEIDEHLGNMIDDEYGVKGLSKNGKQLLDMQSTLRGMIQDANPQDVIGGTGGFDALNNGRAAWSQAAKMQDLEKIMTRAQLSDNPATAVKSGIRTLLSNPSRVRGYSPDEISALQEAGNRGILGGALHVFGSRLVPFVGTAVGESVGGIPGAMLGGAIGHAGSTVLRNAASKIQTGKLTNALETLGRNAPVLPQEAEAAAPQLALPKASISVPPGGFSEQIAQPLGETVAAPAVGTPQITSQFSAPDARALTYQPRPDFTATPEGLVSQVPNAQVGPYQFGAAESMPLGRGEIDAAQNAAARTAQDYGLPPKLLTYQPRPEYAATNEGMVAQVPNTQVGPYSFGQAEGMPIGTGEMGAIRKNDSTQKIAEILRRMKQAPPSSGDNGAIAQFLRGQQ